MVMDYSDVIVLGYNNPIIFEIGNIAYQAAFTIR
jgi:hypothetical protein